MSYLVIDDFRLGMDRRKKRVSGAPGALWEGINGHINRGGDFERRKKFVAKFSLPSGLTVGMAQLLRQLFVFGSGASPAGLPGGVNYQRLTHTGSATLSEILDATSFGGKLYVVALFDNGDIYHYYDGSRVTDWDTLAASIANNASIAAALAAKIDLDTRYHASAIGAVITISAAISGTAFTLSATAVNNGGTNDQTLTVASVQANVAAVAETRATTVVQVLAGSTLSGAAITLAVDNITVGVSLGHPTVTQSGQALTNAINTESVDTGVTAVFDGFDTVTVYAPVGLGASANGQRVGCVVANGMSVNVDGVVVSAPPSGQGGGVAISVMAGGVDAIAAVAQVQTATVAGTFDNTDEWTITLDGTTYKTTSLASGTGVTAFTYNSKIYSVTASLLTFCAVNTPTAWTSGTGYGQINIANQNAGNDALTGIQQYQNRIAVFSRDNIQIWIIAVDPSANTFQQAVSNTGALSNKLLAQYGNIDVFYLNYSGARSLRARDSSNAPAVNDVGVAIDTFLQEFMATLSGAQISRSNYVIEPQDGRYWAAMSNRIFVYSFVPGSKISAWTYYDLSDEIGTADIIAMVKSGQRTYLRAGDMIYLYGGDDNATYPDDDEILAVAGLPFLSAGKPATVKGFTGFNAACENDWAVKLLPDPKDDTLEIDIGTVSGTTLDAFTTIVVEHPGTLFALKMTCSKAGPASISKAILHFNSEEEA